MAPKKIKLTYFAGRGLGELPRLILAAAQVDYENVRVTFEEWPKIKPDLLFGQMPVLECEVDGNPVVLAQSKTIARFLAKEYGLAGKNNVEQAQADMVIDLMLDMRQVVIKAMSGGEEEMKENGKKCFEEDLPKFLKNAENILKERGGKHFAGDQLTWADIHMFEILTAITDATSPVYTKAKKGFFDDRRITVLKDYPLLTGLIQTVQENPGIEKWLKERPSDAEEAF